jgi:GT2 family glycosyltransferase
LSKPGERAEIYYSGTFLFVTNAFAFSRRGMGKMLRLFTPYHSARPTDRTNLLTQTTAIIKTFQRPKCLNRLIRSILRYYPDLQIMVGDDGFQPTPRSDVGYIRLPVDIGLSAGRNALLERVQTPYFLLLDDDVEFHNQTKIEKLVRLVDQDDVDIAAGNCLRTKRKLFFLRSKPQPYHGLFDFRDDELRLVCGHHKQRDGYLLCDIAHNFYVARTDAVRNMGAWDPELRQNEHTEFFVRAWRHGLRVGYCHDVIIRHWIDRPPGYAAFRNRSYHQVAARKIGVDRIIGFQGRPFTVDGPEATIMGQTPGAQIKQAA